MNQYAIGLRLKMTKFTNPHGLQDKANHSTAYELAQLSTHALKNSFVHEIVNCQIHTAL